MKEPQGPQLFTGGISRYFSKYFTPSRMTTSSTIRPLPTSDDFTREKENFSRQRIKDNLLEGSTPPKTRVQGSDFPIHVFFL